MSVKRLALACVVAGFVVACGKGTEGPTATSLTVTPNPVALTSLNQTQQLGAVVKDQNGATMSGFTPTFVSNATGVATVSTTGLVTAVATGSATITVSAAGFSTPVTVTVTQAPAALSKVSGDAQTALENSAVANPLRVKVADALGTGITGVTVTFTIAGGGTLNDSSVATGANGEAQVTWTLGASGQAQSVTAAVAGLTSVVFTATASSSAPAAIVKVSGDAQTGVESAALPNPIKVKVTNGLGAAMSGVSVAFAAQNGGSVSAAAVNTNAAGEAQVTWTLGAGTGGQTATATVTGLTPVTFTATAQSATLYTIEKFAGDAQTALVSNPTNIRPAVRVTNAAAQPVSGVNVTFAITGGGGSISGSTTIATNASGIAQVENWVVGASAGANTMTATGTGTFSGSPTVTFTSTAATKQYNIEIRPVNPAAITPAVQAALDAAEAFWENSIYGDIQGVITGAQDSVCGFPTVSMNETVDDLVIYANIDSIDGPGQVLGSAGPCLVNGVTFLTTVGGMRFDTADLSTMAAAELNAVILHEMGHILGFNSFTWNNGGRTCALNLSSGSAGSVTSLDTHFACAAGRAAFDSIGGTSYTGGLKVPLENCASGVPASCGPGNYNSHWRESVFNHELMTAYLDVGTSAMSRLSLASFIDNGYTVNLAAAQAYSQVFAVSGLRASARVLNLGDDRLRTTIKVLDGRGGVLRTIQP